MAAVGVGVEAAVDAADAADAAAIAFRKPRLSGRSQNSQLSQLGSADAIHISRKPRLSGRSQNSHLSQLSSESVFMQLSKHSSLRSMLNQADVSESHLSMCTWTSPQGGTTCSQELRFMGCMGFPIGFSWLSRVLQQMCLYGICGQIGTVEQSAVANSLIWTSTLDVVFLANFGQMSMLVSAALGNGNKVLVGIWLQIFMVFNTALAVLLLWMRFLAVPLFKNLGVSPLVASAIQSYVLYTIPSMFFDMWYFGLKEWYTARTIVWPETVVEFVAGVATFPILWFFALHLDMGLFGVCVSQGIVSATKCFLYLLLTWVSGCHKDCWHGICWAEIFVRHRWIVLLAGVVPAMVSSFVEGLQFKVLGFVAAGLGAVQTIVVGVSIQLYFLPLCVAIPVADALGVRVGLYLGMFKIDQACLACLVGLACCFGILAPLGFVIAILMHPISSILARDPLVVEGLLEVRWAFLLQCSAMVGVPCIAVLVKQGRIRLICASMPVCYIVMVPIYFIATSIGFTVIGAMLYAQSVAYLGWAIFHIWNIWRSDWKACAMQSSQLAEVSMAETVPEVVMATAGGSMSPLSETLEAVAKSGSNADEATMADASSKDSGNAHNLDRTDSLPMLLSSDRDPRRAFNDISLKGSSMSMTSVAKSQIGPNTVEEGSSNDVGVVINLSGTYFLPVHLSSGETFSI